MNQQTDPFSEGFTSSIMFHRYGDWVLTRRFVEDWLAVDSLAEEAGKQTMSWISCNVWPWLPTSALAKSLAVWKITWQTAGQIEERPKEKFAWSREEGGTTVAYAGWPAAQLNVQATILSRMPESVDVCEAEHFLPSPGT
jgi:hypothetical protein